MEFVLLVTFSDAYCSCGNFNMVLDMLLIIDGAAATAYEYLGIYMLNVHEVEEFS